MTLQDQLLLAIRIATRAHDGQRRKDGTPYIAHAVRVSIRLAPDMKKMIVGLLHDVVEDTDVTLAELLEHGFDKDIIRMVDSVTRRTGETYSDFIKRCAKDKEAVPVKLADIDDNMEDQSALEPEEAEFLSKRYTKARKVLRG